MKKLLSHVVVSAAVVAAFACASAFAGDYEFNTEGGKYTYTYPYYVVDVPQGASNSLASATFTIVKVEDGADAGTVVGYDDFKAATSGTFFKKGKGVLELNEALANWLGQIHVMEGMVVANASQCLGKAAAASSTAGTYVHNGATIYMDNKMKAIAEQRRIAFEGTGCDGRGALLGNQPSSDAKGWDLGLYPTQTGDATMRVLRSGTLFNMTFDPATAYFYQNGYTAFICGDAANAGSGFRLNHCSFEPGNIVFSNMTFTLYGQSPKIKGGAGCYIRFIGKSIFLSSGFGATSPETGRTLIIDDLKYMQISGGDANDLSTRAHCWEGPVVLNCDMPIHCDSNTFGKFGCTGYVSGNGGFPVWNNNTRNAHFHLACETNAFKGVVGMRGNSVLHLHRNGAAPVDCAGLYLTNSTLRLYGAETYRLPKTVFSGACAVTNGDAVGTSSFVKLTKDGTGDLTLKVSASADELELMAGTVTADAGLTIAQGLVFKADALLESTAALTVNGDLTFAANATIDIPSFRRGGKYRVLSATGTISGLPATTKDGDALSLEDGTVYIQHINPYDFPTEDGKYAYTYPYYIVDVPQGASNSLASAAFPIVKVTSIEDEEGTVVDYADFKAATSGTFFKKGKGVLELNEALENWGGQIHVMEGMVVANTSTCLGKLNSGTAYATYVHNGATIYMDNRMKIDAEAKRIVFEGTGVDGRGALLGNQADSANHGWTLCTAPTLSGDATMRMLRNGNIFTVTWSPSSCLYLNGHTATVCGDAANAAGGLRINAGTVTAGHLVLSNVTFVAQGTTPQFGGGLTNTLTLTGKSIYDFYGGNGSKTSWTLIVDDAKYAIPESRGDGANVDTTTRCWQGPVVLNADLPLYGNNSELTKLGFVGPISGNGGFPLYNKDFANMHFHLACPTNSFKGGVTIRNGWLSLHRNGAAPVDCAGLTLTNSSLRLYGTENYRLPQTIFSGTGVITNADAVNTASFVKLTKDGAGDLALKVGASADELELMAGTVTADAGLTIAHGLVFKASALSESTAALTVNGDLVFGTDATIDIPDICRTGDYKLLNVSGSTSGMPTTTKQGDTLRLEGGSLIVHHVNPYDFDDEDGKYTYTYPYYVVTVAEGASNSLASAAFPIVKVTSVEDAGAAVSYDDFKAATAGTFFKTGAGVLELNEALENWGGQIHVMEGMVVANTSTCLGKLNAGTGYATYVHNGATIYMDNRQNLGAEAKRLVIEGDGVDGRGALLGNQASSSELGWDVGTDLTLSGDATLRVLRSGNLFNFTWSPVNQTFHLNGHTAFICGDAANAGSGYRVNNTVVEEGNLVLSNVLFTIYGASPQLKGGAGNYIRLIGKSAIFAQQFAYNSSAETSKTLIFDDCLYLRMNGSDGGDLTTHAACWEGPTELNCNVPLYCISTSLNKFGFTGKVTGEGGFTLYSKDSRNYHLHLAHPENAFRGPVVINGGWLSLHANGAAPVDCAGLTLTNSSIRLYGGETYRLPAMTFYGAGMVTNDVFCRGGFVKIVKKGDGALTLTTGVGAEALELEAGSVAITGAAEAADMPVFGSVKAKPGAAITSALPVTFTNELSFSYQDLSGETPVLTVDGALRFDAKATFVATGTKLAKGTYKLVYASGGITGVPTATQSSNKIYIDTDGRTLMVGTEGGDWPEESASATWVGGAADALMTTMSNWEGAPDALDLTGGTLKANLGGGAEMVYSGRTWLSRAANLTAFPAEGPVTPLWIKPATPDARLEFTRGLSSASSNQLVLVGTVSTPNGVDGGAAGSSSMAIVYTPKCIYMDTADAPMPAGTIEGQRPMDGRKYGSAPLVLAGARVEQPIFIRSGYMSVGLLGYANTTNVILQNCRADTQAALGVMGGGVLDFRGGLNLDYRYRLIGSNQTGADAGEIRISEKPLAANGRLEMQHKVHLVLDVEGNTFGDAGLCIYNGCLDFRRNNCLTDGRYLWSADPAYAFQLEFNTTTQRFGVIRFLSTHASSELRGNYPAMMEITCSATDSDAVPTNTVPINGGLGVHVCGEGTMPLAKQAYKSCGDLEASAGVLELCADASWLNGTNFTARGTGVIRFSRQGQINADFANIRLADSGKIEIPAGVTLSAKTVQLKVGDEWLTFTDPMSLSGATTGALAGRIIGGGTLDVVGLPQEGAKLMTLEWSERYEAGIPYEVEVSTNKLATLGGIPAGTGFNVYAMVNGVEYPLNVTCLAGRNGNVRLRFTPPTGTTQLKCRAGVGTLVIADSATVDNLFAGALGASVVWETPAGITRTVRSDGNLFEQTSKTKVTVTCAVAVPASARGRNAHLELDLTSLTPYSWASAVNITQLDENGTALPESMSDPRWTTLGRPANYLAQHREIGRIHPQAARLRLSITLNAVSGTYDDYGLPITDEADQYARLLVSHLAVRVGADLPFPKYNDAFLTDGVSGEAGDRAFVSGGEKAAGFFYQTRSQASWAEAKQMRKEEQFFFPSQSGTVEGWFKATSWGSDTSTRYFFSGSSRGSNYISDSPAINQNLIYVSYRRSSKTLTFRYMDQRGTNYSCSVVRELPVGEWFHIAAQWMPGGTAELFLNGERVAQTTLTGFVAYDPSTGTYPNDMHVIEMDIGCESYAVRTPARIPVTAYPIFDGAIDLCRISTGKRYDAAGGFVPAKKLEVDADTRAFFSFDTGFDGVSGGGLGWVRASVSALEDMIGHRLALGDGEVQYFPAEVPDWNDSAKVNDTLYHKNLPTVAGYKAARARTVASFDLAVGGSANLSAPQTVYPDYVEIANTGVGTLLNPIVLGAGEVDPRSYGDIRETLLAGATTDREKADRVLQYVTDMSDYYMIHTGVFGAGTDTPSFAGNASLGMLNSYCGFECGPLNTILQQLFTGAALLPASMTVGYGHMFEQVFFEGKTHTYDQSAQAFFPAMDNETRAYLEEISNQPGIMHRVDREPSFYMRHSTRNVQGCGTGYVAKFAPSLRKGERFRVWFRNDGEVNDLQCNGLTASATTENYDDICHAVPGGGGSIFRVNRFFPEFGNGFIVYDGAVDSASEAFSTGGDSFVYSVAVPHPVVAAEYAAELAGGLTAPMQISTDRGATWRDLPAGKLRYQVRARTEYLVKVLAAPSDVRRFTAVTEVQVNSRSYPGKVKGGNNSFTLKALGAGSAKVTFAYRADEKEIVVSGGAYSGTIPGCERQVVLVDPATPLVLDVTGASSEAHVKAKGGLSAKLSDGRLTISAGTLTKGFGAVQIVDGEAVKELRVIVSENARLVTAADTLVPVSGSTLIGPDAGSIQSRVDFVGSSKTARANFASLPSGRYGMFALVRHEVRPGNFRTGRFEMSVPGVTESRRVGRAVNSACDFYKAMYGETEERGRYKWDYPNDPSTSYPREMPYVFDVPAGFDHVDFVCADNADRDVELAALLVLPIDKENVVGDEDFQCEAVKQLCGLNNDPWQVESGVRRKRGIILLVY